MKLKLITIIIFIQHMFLNFDLFGESQKMWSILICTLQEREDKFNFIYNKLIKQIDALNLNEEIEVIYFSDNREHNVGYKRNCLLEASTGKYTCFIDDDDDVHDQYIEMIYERLLKDPDCVSLAGIITFDNINPRVFIHSIIYDSWFQKDEIYYRPPNHLNPIRSKIAKQFAFPEKNHGEDADWSMQICRSKLLKTEEEINIPYYFYQYTSK